MLLLTAKLLAAWPPTRRAGLLIEGRRIWSPGQTLANWRDYLTLEADAPAPRGGRCR